MYILDMKFSDAQILEIVSSGNPAYSWTGLPNRLEIGNFYKTFSMVPNNMGPLDKLFFRSYYIANAPSEDKLGPIYQTTHLHIPLLHCFAAEAGEYISGFKIEGSDRNLEDFGQLNGLQGMIPMGNRVIFSETSTFISAATSNSNSSIYEVKQETGALPTDIPIELAPLVKSGHQLFWLRDLGSYYPFSINFLYNSKIYFNERIAGINMKYRALYFLEAMLPKRNGDNYAGRHMIVGFGVSHDAGKYLRGFGALNVLYADQVVFDPST